jgi:pre-mRNA branch site protein p14
MSSRAPPLKNSRVIFVRNLPYKITAAEMYAVFGRYGALRQVRVGDAAATKGTAFIVYEDAADARAACDALSGFNIGGRYLVVHFFTPRAGPGAAARGAPDLAAEAAEVAALRARVAAGAGDDELDDEADRRRAAALRAAR